MTGAVAVGDVDEALAVARPDDVGIDRGAARDADGFATVAGAGGEDLTVDDEGDFSSVAGEGHFGEAAAEVLMFEGGAGGGAAEFDGELRGDAGLGVDLPDGEVALEDDGAAVAGDGGPGDA